MVRMRQGVGVKFKLDRTAVSAADTAINLAFIEQVRERSHGRDAVRGEEQSAEVQSAERVWIIDPIDGTGEYIDGTVPNARRTSCVGIALLVRGELVLAVVFNPFTNQLLTAERGGRTLLNEQPIRCSSQQAARGVPYDYAHWNGARFNLPRLEATFGEPLGVYSAIWQAAMVAMGHSAFAAFVGDTIHDIAPAALLVLRSGGLVTDFQGRPVNLRNPGPGVLYANRGSHSIALRALRTL
jgi:fructose-1,6-bisphosphatase/inositol monophosphatase family enzyme